VPHKLIERLGRAPREWDRAADRHQNRGGQVLPRHDAAPIAARPLPLSLCSGRAIRRKVRPRCVDGARPARRSSSPRRPSACRSTWLRRLPRSCFRLWLLVTAPTRECPGGIAENRIGEQQEPVSPSATTDGLRRNANFIADNPAAVPNVIQADDDDPVRTHDGATHAVADRPAIELTKRRGFSAGARWRQAARAPS
jgi:hypothetical protein